MGPSNPGKTPGIDSVPGTKMISAQSDVTDVTMTSQESPTSDMEITPYAHAMKRDVSDEGFAETGGGNADKSNVDVEIIYDDDGAIELKQWLMMMKFGEVFCEKYFQAFVVNGYQSLDFIKEIEKKSDLTDIGITLKGHQLKILVEIKKLKQLSQ